MTMQRGERLGDRFVIERRIGAGGMGVVYAANDATTNLTVAVKVLLTTDADSVARFEREVEVLERVRHPNVVAYIAHGTSGAREPFLAMDWLEGETLKERTDRSVLSHSEVVDVALGIARALADVHALGIVHRDIKPANIFLVSGATAEVRVLDFGLARCRAATQPLTMEGDVLGTPQFMSPEQAMGRSTLDERTDLFALGAVLFRCVTGEPPFGGQALEALVRLVQSSAPSVLSVAPHTPPRMARLIDSLLQRDPLQRPESAHAVFGELAQFYAEAGGRGAPRPTRALTKVSLTAYQPPAPTRTAPSLPLAPEASHLPAVAPVTASSKRRTNPNVVTGIVTGSAVVAVGVVAVLAYWIGFNAGGKRDASGVEHRSRAAGAASEEDSNRSTATPSPSSNAQASRDAAQAEGKPRLCLDPRTTCTKIAQPRPTPDDFLAQASAFARQRDPTAEFANGTLFLDSNGMVSDDRTQMLSFAPSWIVAASEGWLWMTPLPTHVAPLAAHCRLGDLYQRGKAAGLDASQGAALMLMPNQLAISDATRSVASRMIMFDARTCTAL